MWISFCFQFPPYRGIFSFGYGALFLLLRLVVLLSFVSRWFGAHRLAVQEVLRRTGRGNGSAEDVEGGASSATTSVDISEFDNGRPSPLAGGRIVSPSQVPLLASSERDELPRAVSADSHSSSPNGCGLSETRPRSRGDFCLFKTVRYSCMFSYQAVLCFVCRINDIIKASVC